MRWKDNYYKLGYNQYRFETINIYKRPRYVTYEDGSRWIIGTSIRITPNGQRINTKHNEMEKQNEIEKQNELETQNEMKQIEAIEPEIQSNDNHEFDEQEFDEQDLSEPLDSNTDDLDIDNVRGIGPKSSAILRQKGIETVDQLFYVIQNDKDMFEELNKEIRGFNKIVDRVNEMCKQ